MVTVEGLQQDSQGEIQLECKLLLQKGIENIF